MNPTSQWDVGEAVAFRTTHWSFVLAAGQKNSPYNKSALDKLCRIYWYPLYAYVRRRGYDENQAKDLTQEFFLRLLEKDLLAGITEEGGKFRSFLLTALKRFLINEWHRSQTQKRGGGKCFISLDNEDPETRYQAEPPDQISPDILFERRWATTLLDQVMLRLETEYKQWRKAELFNRLQNFLAGSLDSVPYRELGGQLGMSEGAVKVAVHRLKKRYGELLREEIARTVTNPDEVEQEIRYLISVLADTHG